MTPFAPQHGKMCLSFAILTTLLAALAAHAIPQGQPSSTPGCFTCPPEDKGNYALGESNPNSNPIFCSYPVFVGEGPFDFYCDYSAVSIHLCLSFVYHLTWYELIRPLAFWSQILMLGSALPLLSTIAPLVVVETITLFPVLLGQRPQSLAT
jgi:hypothetical protein